MGCQGLFWGLRSLQNFNKLTTVEPAIHPPLESSSHRYMISTELIDVR